MKHPVFFTVMMEVTGRFDSSVHLCQTTLRQIKKTQVFMSKTAFKLKKFTKVLQTQKPVRKKGTVINMEFL
jgi:hypothetical protein